MNEYQRPPRIGMIDALHEMYQPEKRAPRIVRPLYLRGPRPDSVARRNQGKWHPNSVIALLAAKLRKNSDTFTTGENAAMAVQKEIETECPSCDRAIKLIDFDPEEKGEDGADIECPWCGEVFTDWNVDEDGELIIAAEFEDEPAIEGGTEDAGSNDDDDSDEEDDDETV